jgi:predicted nucleotidyltransferase
MSRLEALTRDLVQSCTSVYGTELVSVVLFGSWARGAATPVSDIDVLIVAEDLPRGRTRRLAPFERVEADTEVARQEVWRGSAEIPELSPVFRTPEEVRQGSPLFLDMTEWCRILWNRDGFFASYLEELRQRMKRLGTRRRRAKGGSYWEYKPDLEPGEVVEL